MKLILKRLEKENKNVIIYYNANLNEGIIGIIASRLKDYFNKPSIVITNQKIYLRVQQDRPLIIILVM